MFKRNNGWIRCRAEMPVPYPAFFVGQLPAGGTIRTKDTVLPRHRPKSSMRQTGADSPAPSQTVHWTVCVPLWRERAVRIPSLREKQKALSPDSERAFFVVGVTGFEPTASWSRTKRATNCATPRKKIRSNFAAAVVGDERIELPQTESESVALPLCKSPLHVC